MSERLQSSWEKKKRLVAQWMLLFLVAAMAGWAYEMIYFFVDQGGILTRRGSGYGPWLPIYGFGAVFICFGTRRFRDHPLVVLLLSGVIAGMLELGTGWLLFTRFDGLRLWDYSSETWIWGNIGGFVCAKSVTVFGFAGVGAVYLLQPLLEQLTQHIEDRRFCGAVFSAFTLFAVDVYVGYFVRGMTR